MSLRPRAIAAVASLTAALSLSAAPAQATTLDTVTAAATVAYEAYKRFGSGELTLNQATTQIINAINGAMTEIITHIDRMAASTVRACTKSAVIDLADIRRMSRDTVQAFAGDTTTCVTTAESLIADAR